MFRIYELGSKAFFVVCFLSIIACGGGDKPQPVTDEGVTVDEGSSVDEGTVVDEGAGSDTVQGPESCSDSNGGCDANAACSMDENSVISCACNEGFEGDGLACQDTDECAGANDCAQNCTNLEGSYECACEPGFLSEDEGRTCTDIDECAVENECGENAVCTNEDGSYSCACGEGYDGDGFLCEDIDECTLEGDQAVSCSENSECVNSDGGYDCVCSSGFGHQSAAVEPPVNDPALCETYCQLAETNCVDDNVLEWGESDCLTVCAGYSHAGLDGDASGDSVQCRIYHLGDPASADPAIHCPHGASDGGGVCVGEVSVPEPAEPVDEELNCVNIDECSLEGEDAVCDPNASCTDSVGAYACECNSGFEGDGATCADIDECSGDELLDSCGGTSTCNNNEGSFTCDCAEGFVYDDTVLDCLDVDECTAETDNCDVHALCSNTPGSFTCSCNSGYDGDGLACTNIDECSDAALNGCDANASCTDDEGSFSCACNAGYDGDGETCTNVDECADAALNNCGANSACTDSDGSFSCGCLTGYDGDGLTCSDVDECAAAESPCGGTSTCNNTDGAFTCDCAAGYVYDDAAMDCLNVDECADATLNDCDANALCSDTDGSWSCACAAGYSGDGTVCSNVDECADATLNDCDANALCTDTDGSWSCACAAGYEGDGTSCGDTDECAFTGDDAVCDNALQACENTVGSYTCSALPTGTTCQTAGDASSGSLALTGLFTANPSVAKSCGDDTTNAVWFSYTPTLTGVHTVDVSHLSFFPVGTEVVVYDACGDGAVEAACSTSATASLSLDVSMELGKTYYVLANTEGGVPHIENPSIAVAPGPCADFCARAASACTGANSMDFGGLTCDEVCATWWAGEAGDFNGVYDVGEPYTDTIPNKKWDSWYNDGAGEEYIDVVHGNSRNCRLYYLDKAEGAEGILAEQCVDAGPGSIACQYTPGNHCSAPYDVSSETMPFELTGFFDIPAIPPTCQPFPGSAHWLHFTPNETGLWTIWSNVITGMAVYSVNQCDNVSNETEIACKKGFLHVDPLQVELEADVTYLIQMFHSSSGGLFFEDPTFHFYAPGAYPP